MIYQFLQIFPDIILLPYSPYDRIMKKKYGILNFKSLRKNRDIPKQFNFLFSDRRLLLITILPKNALTGFIRISIEFPYDLEIMMTNNIIRSSEKEIDKIISNMSLKYNFDYLLSTNIDFPLTSKNSKKHLIADWKIQNVNVQELISCLRLMEVIRRKAKELNHVRCDAREKEKLWEVYICEKCNHVEKFISHESQESRNFDLNRLIACPKCKSKLVLYGIP